MFTFHSSYNFALWISVNGNISQKNIELAKSYKHLKPQYFAFTNTNTCDDCDVRECCEHENWRLQEYDDVSKAFLNWDCFRQLFYPSYPFLKACVRWMWGKMFMLEIGSMYQFTFQNAMIVFCKYNTCRTEC